MDTAECSVHVTNDIKPGLLSFASNLVTAKQSDKEVVIPVERTQRTKGVVIKTIFFVVGGF